VHKLEEDVKHLRGKQALCEERAADRHLQDQVRGRVQRQFSDSVFSYDIKHG